MARAAWAVGARSRASRLLGRVGRLYLAVSDRVLRGYELDADTRTQAADSVLQRGVTALGSNQGLLTEMAQLQLAFGNWGKCAALWRSAMAVGSYMDQSPTYSLGTTRAPQPASGPASPPGPLAPWL